jgi:hypothetical protein
LSMISAQTLRVCREGKPLHAFPDPALVQQRQCAAYTFCEANVAGFRAL